jgi:hypothetical protein
MEGFAEDTPRKIRSCVEGLLNGNALVVAKEERNL